MRKFTKILFLVAVAFFLTGCVGPQKTEDTEQSKERETEMPEITMFDVNSGEYQFDDRIAREIMKQTGVKINIMDPTDDVTEKVSLMLAYQDYPDMILVNISNIQKYVDEYLS